MMMKVSENFVQRLITNTLDKEKPAYIYKNTTVSYSQLFNHATNVAGSLVSWGFRPGDRLLLLMNDTPALPAVFLASIYVGIIPVALNPRMSGSSLVKTLEHSEACGVVLEKENEALKSILSDKKINLIIQDLYIEEKYDSDVPHKLSENISTSSEVEFYRDQPYCQFWQYTSGTSGDPKAVIHSTKGMEENTTCFAKGVLGISSADKIYSTAKMHFGYGLGNSLFFTLLNNATALLDDKWPTTDIVVENIKSFSPTVFCSVPNMYNSISMQSEEIYPCFDKKIKLLSAGSPLPQKIYTLWKERFGSEIIDGLGATELGHIFLCKPIGNLKKKGSTLVSGYKTFLEKREGGEAKVGEQGVLYVNGPSVAKGYYNNKESTEKRFVEGWYRTGDIFLRESDNSLVYVGREDDLFKVKGKWVVPSKVENHILTVFDNVKEVALVPHTNMHGLLETALMVNTSYCKKKYEDLKLEIEQTLKDHFPSYIRPLTYIFMDDLPKNENGKLIRKMVSQKNDGNTYS